MSFQNQKIASHRGHGEHRENAEIHPGNVELFRLSRGKWFLRSRDPPFVFLKAYRGVARRMVAYAAMSVGLSRGNQRDPAIPYALSAYAAMLRLGTPGNANF